MIFVTVGSQLPFDRLTGAVDAWAADHPEAELFGQVGDTDEPPENFSSVSTMSPEEYQQRFSSADLIVGHAGMGTIFAALEFGKPLLMLPRRASLMESRNDNQLGTARHFRCFAQFEAVEQESKISAMIDHMLANADCYPCTDNESVASDSLVDAIREFVGP